MAYPSFVKKRNKNIMESSFVKCMYTLIVHGYACSEGPEPVVICTSSILMSDQLLRVTLGQLGMYTDLTPHMYSA